MFKIFALILIPFFAFAQNDPVLFSLESAVEFAFQNNINAKNSDSDVRLAQLQKWQTTSTGLPQISANVSYNNWIKQQVSLIPAEFFGGTPGQFTEVAFGTTQTMNGSVTLNQKIFDGSYLVGLQAAKVYLEISKNAKEKTLSELRKAVTNAYGNILMTEENLKIINSNIRILEKNISELEEVYNNGMIEQESLEQLQLTLAGLESSKNYNLNLKKIAYQMFNLTIGLDINTKVQLLDSLEKLVLATQFKSLENLDNKVENVVDFKIAKNDFRSKELLLKLEKSKALPTINAFINGSYSGNSNQFGFLKSSQKWFGASQFGINMSIPLFSSFGRTSLTQKAKINLEKSKRNLNDVKQKIELEIQQAKNDLDFALQDLNTKKQSLALAERIEHKNQIKFSEGIASSFELSQAQSQLYSAQQQYIQGMFNLINKYVILDTLINPIKN
jgi:outer membrane protein TolC